MRSLARPFARRRPTIAARYVPAIFRHRNIHFAKSGCVIGQRAVGGWIALRPDTHTAWPRTAILVVPPGDVPGRTGLARDLSHGLPMPPQRYRFTLADLG